MNDINQGSLTIPLLTSHAATKCRPTIFACLLLTSNKLLCNKFVRSELFLDEMLGWVKKINEHKLGCVGHVATLFPRWSFEISDRFQLQTRFNQYSSQGGGRKPSSPIFLQSHRQDKLTFKLH